VLYRYIPDVARAVFAVLETTVAKGKTTRCDTFVTLPPLSDTASVTTFVMLLMFFFTGVTLL
jgi:hypothetical protein